MSRREAKEVPSTSHLKGAFFHGQGQGQGIPFLHLRLCLWLKPSSSSGFSRWEKGEGPRVESRLFIQSPLVSFPSLFPFLVQGTEPRTSGMAANILSLRYAPSTGLISEFKHKTAFLRLSFLNPFAICFLTGLGSPWEEARADPRSPGMPHSVRCPDFPKAGEAGERGWCPAVVPCDPSCWGYSGGLESDPGLAFTPASQSVWKLLWCSFQSKDQVQCTKPAAWMAIPSWKRRSS